MTHQQPDGVTPAPMGGYPTGAPTSRYPVPAQHSPPGTNPPTTQVSSPPNHAAASPAPNGYALGVDLGTSHTVAVIRWPDGRCRPLLVDGAPVMPSAVFLDESGHIHVGRDAQRLAQTDPTRYEPNPKHRISEPTVLLGDREVPTAALLAAILRNVASKAVETIGHLPPAVLTCPAKWGPQRRSILEDAAAQAGFPPVTVVPEPVAAAHYFAEVMRQPIPVGKSVAVFDFGGGTLDIAVVRHDSDGGFIVQADGGLDDLGGLDIDAALVEYLGRTISASVPQVWQQLTQPHNGTDRRNRRLFWDDVRGAKEMLSRTTVAPVPVPGVEASLHMTRDELERLAGPLLTRAVAETQRVIAATGQTPEQLAGLFLVGGASRIPLVTRMLHSQLGIAPTVLEQPELPVAEGSLAAAFPATAPTSPAAPSSPAPVPPPGDRPEGFLEPAEPAKPWYKRKATWLGLAAGVVVLALLGAWLLYDPYPQREMNSMTQVGEPVPAPLEDGYYYEPKTNGDVAYFPVSDSGGEENYLTAVDMTTGKEKWTTDAIDGYGFEAVHGVNNVLYVSTKADDIDPEYELTMVDMETGDLGRSITVGGTTTQVIVGDHLVSFDYEAYTVTGYDASGTQDWNKPLDLEFEHGAAVASWSGFAEPVGSPDAEHDGRVYVRDDAGTVVILDAETGKVVTDKKIGGENDIYLAYEGRMFLVPEEENPTLAMFDLDEGLGSIDTLRLEGAGVPTSIEVCGETRVCVHGDTDEDDTPDRVNVVDFSQTQPELTWQSDDKKRVNTIRVTGETVALGYVNSDGEDLKTQLYNADFETIGGEQEGSFKRIDSGSFLKRPSVSYESGSSYVTSPDEAFAFVGLGARDGEVYQLGSQNVIKQCTANAAYIACATEAGYSTWQFR